MKNIRDTGARFNRPPDFSISDVLSQSFGVFSGKARHAVRIRFDAFAARLVAERQWHPSQKIRSLDGGDIELRLTVGSFEEIERWILSWGAHAEVLAPGELISRIQAIVGILASVYRVPAGAAAPRPSSAAGVTAPPRTPSDEWRRRN